MGNDVLVVRIEKGVLVGWVDVLEVGDLGFVELHQQTLPPRDIDDVVAREHDVVFAARFELHEHLLVRLKGAVVHLDARLLGKLREDVVGEIGGPSEDVEHLLIRFFSTGAQ